MRRQQQGSISKTARGKRCAAFPYSTSASHLDLVSRRPTVEHHAGLGHNPPTARNGSPEGAVFPTGSVNWRGRFLCLLAAAPNRSNRSVIVLIDGTQLATLVFGSRRGQLRRLNILARCATVSRRQPEQRGKPLGSPRPRREPGGT